MEKVLKVLLACLCFYPFWVVRCVVCIVYLQPSMTYLLFVVACSCSLYCMQLLCIKVFLVGFPQPPEPILPLAELIKPGVGESANVILKQVVYAHSFITKFIRAVYCL